MADLRICRICLRTEAKTYKLDQFQLQSYYEEVMGLKMSGSQLPQRVCFECAASLHASHRFKEKCYRGLAAFNDLLRRGPLSYEAVYNIDKEERQLQSTLQIMTVTNRVKYYFTREEHWPKDDEILSDNMEQTECEQSDLDIDHKEEDSVDFPKDILLDKVSVPNKANDTKFINSDDTKFNDKEDTTSDFPINQEHLNDDESAEIMESKSVIVTVIKDKSSVDITAQDPVAIESEMVPVIEFIDIKKEGLKEEELVYKKRKERTTNSKNGGPKIKRSLDASQWSVTSLSEAEALDVFRSRATRAPYCRAAHRCTACFRPFRSAPALRRHRRRHSESAGRFECRVCRVRFAHESALLSHSRSHYLRLRCLRCSHVCSQISTALLHEDSHSGPKKKCVHCGEEFRHRSTLCTHARTHRSAHVCTQCGVSCVSPAGLARHTRLAHTDSASDSAEEAEYCARCDLRFESRRAYREHLFHSLLHTDTDTSHDRTKDDAVPRKIQGKRKKAQILKEWSKKETVLSGPFSQYSQFSGTTGPAKDPKRRTITGEVPAPDAPCDSKRRKKPKKLKRKPTTCYQCGEQFSTQLQCMKHHVATHPRTSFYPPAARHICELCGASLAPSSVSAHVNMHSRERLYSCDTCGRAFHASVGLKRHLLTHTGAKPYACSLCDKRFTQNNSMKLHYRTVHLKQPYPKRNRSRPAARTQPPDAEPAVALPQSAVALPQSAVALPQSAVALPQSAVALPQSAVVPPQSAVVPSQPAAHYLTLT